MNTTVVSRATGLALLLIPILLGNEGTTPRPSPKDYPAQVEFEHGTLAAEYNVHSAIADGKSAFVGDYLAFEVALYPIRGHELPVSTSRFSLRLNHSKGVIPAAAPNMVAASLKYSDWESQREMTVESGPIIVGRKPQSERFPGDNRPPHGPRPNVITRKEEDNWITEISMRENAANGPVSGYVFFDFHGKVQKLKSIELIYTATPESKPVVLKLR